MEDDRRVPVEQIDIDDARLEMRVDMDTRSVIGYLEVTAALAGVEHTSITRHSLAATTALPYVRTVARTSPEDPKKRLTVWARHIDEKRAGLLEEHVEMMVAEGEDRVNATKVISEYDPRLQVISGLRSAVQAVLTEIDMEESSYFE